MLKTFPPGEICWPRRVVTAADAVRFIDAVGFCLLVSIKDLPLPSLYYALARRDIRDGPGWDRFMQKIWAWKDELPRRRRAFYAKYFKGRGTFLSLEMLPHFLALEQAAVAPGDRDRLYAAGLISHDARVLWAALDEEGPLATLELRHACNMGSRTGNARFKRALLELQRKLLVVHCGIERETAAWASGRFVLTCRLFLRQTAAARKIPALTARAAIVARYLKWHPDARLEQLRRVFAWPRTELVAAATQAQNREG